MIDAPSVAAPDEPFAVMVVTYGGGCTNLESTPVTLTDDGAIVTPYDRTFVGGTCTTELKYIRHQATISLTVGMRTLHVVGLDDQHKMVDVPVPITVQ